MKYKSLFVIMLLASLFSSCVEDDSEVGGADFPTVAIAGSELSDMQVLSVDLGKICRISPDLVLADGCQASDLTYEWGIGSYNTETGAKGGLTTVSSEPVFSYLFFKGGTYYVHLKVTNGFSGDAIDYQVNVDRSFEEGILIVAADESGNDNISFIKTLTEDEIAAGKELSVQEHCVASMNEGLDMSGLRGAGTTMLEFGASSRSFFVALKDKAYFLDPSTFSLISVSKYSEAIEGFEASYFFMYDYYGSQPTVFDENKGRILQIERQFGYVFIPSSPFYQQRYEQLLPGYTYFARYDWYMGSPVAINYSTSELYSPSVTWNLPDREIISAFQNTVQYSVEVYCVSRGKQDPNKVYQEVCTYEYDDDWNLVPCYTEMEHEVSVGEVLPEKGTVFCYDKTNLVSYYVVDGKMYAYYPTNTSLSFPSVPVLSYENEEITSVTLNEKTAELYVGTYNHTTKRGSVYIYSSSSVRVDAPIKVFPSCTDKIMHISYKKRSL